MNKIKAPKEIVFSIEEIGMFLEETNGNL